LTRLGQERSCVLRVGRVDKEAAASRKVERGTVVDVVGRLRRGPRTGGPSFVRRAHGRGSYRDEITLALIGHVHVVAVTLRLRFRYLGSEHSISDTSYFTRVRGDWKGLWELSD
jgi:hypothetical protein